MKSLNEFIDTINNNHNEKDRFLNELHLRNKYYYIILQLTYIKNITTTGEYITIQLNNGRKFKLKITQDLTYEIKPRKDITIKEDKKTSLLSKIRRQRI